MSAQQQSQQHRLTATDQSAVAVTRGRCITEAERLNRVSPVESYSLIVDLCGLANESTHFLAVGVATSAEIDAWLAKANASLTQAQTVQGAAVQFTTAVTDMYGYLQYGGVALDRYSVAVQASPEHTAFVRVAHHLIVLGFEPLIQQYLLSVSIADEASQSGWRPERLEQLDTLDSAFDLLHSFGLIVTTESSWQPAPRREVL